MNQCTASNKTPTQEPHLDTQVSASRYCSGFSPLAAASVGVGTLPHAVRIVFTYEYLCTRSTCTICA